MEDLDYEKWLSGFAVCRVCGHTWVVVTPAAGQTTNLECPNCHTMSGEMGEEHQCC